MSNLYFGILLIEAQRTQNQLNIQTLQSQLNKAEVALQNGTTLPSNVAELKAEILRVTMQSTEYEATQASYLQMLSIFIGKELTSATQLTLPASELASKPLSSENLRPELEVFQLQESLLKAQEKQLNSEYMPKLSAFFQGGYGRPTLNILNNQADFYYITGVRLQWNLSPLYNLSSKKNILRLSRESLLADRDTFLRNTQLDLTQQSEQLKKLQKLIEQDKENVTLHQSVTQAAQVQLDNGVITTHEYLQKINAQHLAQQTLQLHQIQLIQAQENQKLINGQSSPISL